MPPRKFSQPNIIPCSEHGLSPDKVNKNALKVLSHLNKSGYQAYLVGGCIRDALLGLKPKDFDVATDAHPEQVRKLFRNSRLIGKRFRLAHVYFSGEIIEVSTFRASHNAVTADARKAKGGRIIRDNVYGKLDDDVWRRDFTINALYCNIQDFSIVDYVNGMQDIKNQQLRAIGVSADRYREDPVRMLRAVRFATKLGFSIHPTTEKPIFNLVSLLADVPNARIFEEFLKLFMHGNSLQSYQQLLKYGLFQILFPQIDNLLLEGDESLQKLLLLAFSNTDQRLQENKSVTPIFLLAVILWKPVINLCMYHQEQGLNETEAMLLAASTVISKQIKVIAIPKHLTHKIRDIWLLQIRLKNVRGKRALRLLAHKCFRLAYDFLLLRAAAGEAMEALDHWWTEFQDKHMDVQLAAREERHKK
ncbi:Poly(A) polymerase [uncultured Candidatus Thioglobus sp.]|nr:Poly(A) polymerase [uncultured Candidatus Thioglobus sp.]